jgi:hypothetical protein
MTLPPMAVMPFETVAWLTIGDVAAAASMTHGAAWSEQEWFALAMSPEQQLWPPPGRLMRGGC